MLKLNQLVRIYDFLSHNFNCLTSDLIVGLAIAGEGGLASSKPIATAIAGPGSLAVVRPISTAISGISPNEAASFGLPISHRFRDTLTSDKTLTKLLSKYGLPGTEGRTPDGIQLFSGPGFESDDFEGRSINKISSVNNEEKKNQVRFPNEAPSITSEFPGLYMPREAYIVQPNLPYLPYGLPAVY